MRLDESSINVVRYSPVCAKCTNLTSCYNKTCKAYPDKIPAEIWDGKNQHTAPYPGDNGILFEQKSFDHISTLSTNKLTEILLDSFSKGLNPSEIILLLRMSLNPKQIEAVNNCGIQLILAGPGSGKTKVITEKILHLLDQGILPRQILALTFSEKAAAEMSERVEQQRPHLDLDIHTFHSFCLDVLRENVLSSGLSVSGGIISKTNQLVWGLRNIDAFGFEHIKVGNNAAEIVKAVIDGISAFRDELITPAILQDYLDRKQWAHVDDDEREYLLLLTDLLKVYRAYEQYKRNENLIDFDDMIHGAVNLFRTNPTLRSAYRSRFRYILVDEFQDTNFAQLELIKEIGGENLCVVGDDDQTIYRFRGAYLTNIVTIQPER